MIDLSNSFLQKIEIDKLSQRQISFYIKRDDLIHPEVSGNKWRKLKYNIEVCLSGKKEGVITLEELIQIICWLQLRRVKWSD